MHFINMNTITLLSVLLFCPETVKIDYKVELVTKGDSFFYIFSGTTNLPDETVLDFAVKYINEEETDGKIDREEFSVHDNSPDPIRLKDGKFEVKAYQLYKKPFSTGHAAYINVKLSKQPMKVLTILNERFKTDDDISTRIEFTVGEPKNLPKEIESSTSEIRSDFQALFKLFDNIKQTTSEHKKKYNEQLWNKFVKEITPKIESIKNNNDKRLEWWAVFIERMGKYSIDETCVDFIDLLESAGDAFAIPDQEKHDNLYLRIDGVENRMQLKYEGLDLELVQSHQIETLLKKIDTLTTDLSKMLSDKETFKKEWPALKTKLQKGMILDLFELSKSATKRGHSFVSTISQSISKILNSSENYLTKSGEISDIKKRIEELNTAIKDFKTYAGIKETPNKPK